MRVGQLKSLLANASLPDDAPVLIPSSDHSYRMVEFRPLRAREIRGRNYYCEDSGDDADHQPEEVVIEALVGN